MGKFIDEVKKYHVGLFVMGILLIIAGLLIDNAMAWIDQITLMNIESCIADMHFRNTNEIQFQECIFPDLKKIESIQQINAYATIFYSTGGVLVGLGFRKKSE